MKIFDLIQQKTEIKDKRGVKVLFQNDRFKTRLIVLEQGGSIPACDMSDFVLFYIVEGDIHLRKNDQTTKMNKNQLIVLEPSVVSMESAHGARIMGIQINPT